LKTDDLALASLAVHAAGTLALFLARVHKDHETTKRPMRRSSRSGSRQKN
jgi:hypothetical protein